STSPPLFEIVNPSGITVSLTSSNPASFAGQSLLFTATVTGLTPTGTVTFWDGATLLGTATLADGIGSLTTSALALGNHTILANYSGDSNNSSAAGLLSQTVSHNATTITFSLDNYTSVTGQSVTLTATVEGTLPDAPTPTGTVTFSDGSTVLGTATPSNGVAT